MKQITLLLKTAVILIGITVTVLAVILWFTAGGTAVGAAANGLILGYVISSIFIGVALSMIPFYAALVQTFKLLTYIDHQAVFSHLAVQALKKIKRYAFIISGIYIVILPLVFVLAEWDDAPGLAAVSLVPAFGAFIIGIFSKVLEQLLEEAVTFKMENDFQY